jgi:ribosomal-protein-alanine N-acetyltransferase
MLNHKGTVTLETERLILRRFEISDADAMFRNWASDPEVTKYLTWPTHTSPDVSKAVISSWIGLYSNDNHYSWAIVLKELGEPIGSIAAVKQAPETDMVHIGYCIGRAWWHKGYTSEALCRLVKFFFEEVGANRIESRHDPRNPNSGKVMQKAGLKYEGTLRQSDKNNQGGFCDAAYYAILAEDWYSCKSY